jgi:6-phosphogluconolactonase
MLMLVGTYTRGTDSLGIYGFEVDTSPLSFNAIAVNEGIDNPSYVMKHPDLPVIFSVNEVRDFGGEGGAISAFSLSEDGKLTLINQVPSLGSDPCHLELAQEGRLLLVSNYTSGTLASIPLGDTGELGSFNNFIQHTGHSVDPMRQKSAHVHSIRAGPNDKYIYVADLGLDQILRYSLDSTGHVNASERSMTRMRPGAGPRHFCFDADFEHCYVINELDNTIVSFAVNNDGVFVELAIVSALPAGYQDASYCGEIQLSDDGRFLYGSNRGHDSMVVFEVLGNGTLQWVQHIESGGMHPRHFKITPDGSHLIVANRDSSNLVVFERDTFTGKLSRAGIELIVPAPVCILYG